MKKQIKNIIIITFILILILPVNTINVFATGIGDSPYLEKGNLGFYSIQYCSKSSGNWYYITYSRTYYKDENGIKRIAYCVDPDLNGIGWIEGESDGYHVDLNKALSDARLWRVYRNGYPYVTPSELGVETEDDAYLATKQAGYWIIRGYKLEDIRTYFRPGETEINGQRLEDIQRRGKKVIDAIYHLVDLGYNGKETPKYNNLIKINKSGSFSEDENKDYYSQKYTVTSETVMSSYQIKSISGFPDGSYVANLNGNKQTTFDKGKQFKIMVPKSSIINNIEGKIEIQGKCKNYPIYYGEARDKESQNYAITVESYSDIIDTFNLNINAFKSSIKLIKIDKETKERLSGVKFNFRYENGANIGTYTTDKNGEINIKNLKQGNVIVTEIETKEEYILNSKESSINLGYNESVTIEIENEHKKGNLNIYKVDEDNHKIVLEGVKFNLYSHELKKVVGTYKTDKNGEIHIEGLRTGKYSLIEEETNKWYNLAKNKEIKLEWNESINVTIENELKKSQIRIVKVDKENNKIKLANVKFQVLDKNMNVLETITTNKEGEAFTSKYALRDYKELYIKEIKTNDKYVLDNEIHKIELKENEIVNMKFENKKIKGRIKIIKTAKDDNKITNQKKGDKLKGVSFGVYDENKNLIETITTDENGEAVTSLLEKGKKYVKELEAAKWYILDEKEYSIDIIEDGKIEELRIENASENPDVKIEKTGNTVSEPNQEIRYNFNIKNTGNVALDNFTWFDYLPADYINITKLTTGTYNQDLNYNMYYKTNKNDYRLLKENLSTQINNYIDFSSIVLDEDEVITEIKAEFGKVDIGFESVRNPIIFAKVNSGVKNNDVFINKTELIGYHKTYKVNSEDEHITEIHKEEVKIKKLPRTGR